MNNVHSMDTVPPKMEISEHAVRQARISFALGALYQLYKGMIGIL